MSEVSKERLTFLSSKRRFNVILGCTAVRAARFHLKCCDFFFAESGVLRNYVNRNARFS